MIIKKFSLFTLLFISMSSWLIAEDASYCDDDSPSGISVDVESKALVSVFRSFVLVDDRVGVRNAVMVAEEGAKGQIIRWFSQEGAVERDIVDSNALSGTTTQLTDSSGKQTTSSVTRETAQTISNFTRSTATDILEGLQKFEESYDAGNLEVCVAMATSARSKEMVNEVKGWMNTKKKFSDNDSSDSDKQKTDTEVPAKPTSYYRKRKPI